MLNETLGKRQWILMTLGTFLIFMPMLALGIIGMRRRVIVYTGPGFQQLHLVTAVGGFLVFAGLVVLAYNLVKSSRRGSTGRE